MQFIFRAQAVVMKLHGQKKIWYDLILGPGNYLFREKSNIQLRLVTSCANTYDIFFISYTRLLGGDIYRQKKPKTIG